MSERLDRPYPVIKLGESVEKMLQDIGRRSKNPNLLDKVTLPFDTYVAESLAGLLDMTPEEIAQIRDSDSTE